VANPLPVATFDRGGILPPGLSLSYNGLGRPEALTRAGGTQTVNFNVNVAPAVAAANPRLGQEIAQHLNPGLRGGGRLGRAGTPIGGTRSGESVMAKGHWPPCAPPLCRSLRSPGQKREARWARWRCSSAASPPPRCASCCSTNWGWRSATVT